MSVLRYSTPSRPRPTIENGGLVVLDDGASPRIDRARPGMRFTPLTEAIPNFKGMQGVELRAKALPDRKPRPMTVVNRCGRIMRTGEACYRRKGHGIGCASREAVERDNAKRRRRV